MSYVSKFIYNLLIPQIATRFTLPQSVKLHRYTVYVSGIILTHNQKGINMKNIKLVALDLDGTLFNKESIISKRNLATIKKAT